MEWKIYHNPRCSKSRQALAILESQGISPKVIEYLKTPPSIEELKKLSDYLGLLPSQFIRVKEAEYVELGLSEQSTEEELFKAMIVCPKLIERPIIVRGEVAVLGRPPENIEPLFKV